MKKMTAILLLTTVLLTAVACAATPADTTESTAKATTTEAVTDTVPEPTSFALDESFVIVYPENATEVETNAVNAIVTALKKLNISIGTQKDTATSRANEILVGNTARELTQSVTKTLSENDFTLRMQSTESENKIVLAAKGDIGMELAVHYFIANYLSAERVQSLPLTLSFTHKQKEVTIAGTPLSQYTVVYAQEGVGSNKDIQAAKYADTVEVFVSLLEKATGVRLQTVPDAEKIADGTPLILFGSSSRKNDDSLYSVKLKGGGADAYAAKLMTDGTVALAGNNACSVLGAGEAMIHSLLGESADITALNISGKKDLTHVACVGDSITYGTNSSDPSMQSYPVYLQRMLGYNYYVEKYGAPSHSLIETDTPSFLKHEYFRKSTNATPDVVIVMLGTNDCRTQKWEDSAYKDWSDPARKEAFLAAGQKLIDAYRKRNNDVQIIFSTCPTVPQDS
ncbi:MAG: hypothetical protein IJW46_01965, partial [Clostridia bacterium]|nr:hypothetical protein [Clostridia bacterium]